MFLPVWVLILGVILLCCFQDEIKGFLTFLAGLALLGIGFCVVAWWLFA
jgi:hypothetical protein